MVNHYANIQSVADTDRKGMRILVMAADLEQAIEQLDLFGYVLVLMVGILGIPQAAVARLLEVDQSTISRKYAEVLDDLHLYINGG